MRDDDRVLVTITVDVTALVQRLERMLGRLPKPTAEDPAVLPPPPVVPPTEKRCGLCGAPCEADPATGAFTCSSPTCGTRQGGPVDDPVPYVVSKPSPTPEKAKDPAVHGRSRPAIPASIPTPLGTPKKKGRERVRGDRVLAVMCAHPERRWWTRGQLDEVDPSLIGSRGSDDLAALTKAGVVLRDPDMAPRNPRMRYRLADDRVDRRRSAVAAEGAAQDPQGGPRCPVCGFPATRGRAGRIVCLDEACAAHREPQHQALPAASAPRPRRPVELAPDPVDAGPIEDIGAGQGDPDDGSHLAVCAAVLRKRASHWMTAAGILEVIRRDLRRPDLPESTAAVITATLRRQRTMPPEGRRSVPGLQARLVDGRRWEYRVLEASSMVDKTHKSR
ncbi:MAG: hypothetical protein WC683_00900 [bacterium]